MLCRIVAAVLSVDDDGLDQRVFELDAVGKLLADQSSDGRQEEQRTERQDAEVNGLEQHVEEREPVVLAVSLADHRLGDTVVEAAAVYELGVTSAEVDHLLETHPAAALQRRLHTPRHHRFIV